MNTVYVYARVCMFAVRMCNDHGVYVCARVCVCVGYKRMTGQAGI